MLSKVQLDQIRMLVANQNSPFAQVMFIPELIQHIDEMEKIHTNCSGAGHLESWEDGFNTACKNCFRLLRQRAAQEKDWIEEPVEDLLVYLAKELEINLAALPPVPPQTASGQ